MLSEPDFDDVVLFDVPAEHAAALSARLSATRITWLQRNDEEEFFVVAALRVEPDDLVQLLRDVETWIAESGLVYLRFILDGREYMLQAHVDAPAGRASSSTAYRPSSSS